MIEAKFLSTVFIDPDIYFISFLHFAFSALRIFHTLHFQSPLFLHSAHAFSTNSSHMNLVRSNDFLDFLDWLSVSFRFGTSLYGLSDNESKCIAKTFVYKHCFCYLNVENIKQKNFFVSPTNNSLIGTLKWYYDQKVISLFCSDFESVFAKHPTGKILSFVLYPKVVYFACKLWI